MSEHDDFEDGRADPPGAPFVLRLDGFEGPIDLLLALAREQKVDLTRLSILQLAEQYLAFVQEARTHRLELAADYLVMAAWLAYLKSRLLLPSDDGDGEEPSGADMAAALQFQLRRLEAMREAAARLFARPRLGVDMFRRGAPEGIRVNTRSVQADTLFDLLSAYATTQRKVEAPSLTIRPSALFSVSEALQRLRAMLGGSRDWTALMTFLPPDIADDDRVRRSAAAALLGAGLELAKSGAVYLKQDRQFGPIYVRRRQPAAASPTVVGGSEST